MGGFCFRTILISSNGNICYSLFTLSAVVVSRFASHLVTGFSYELELIVVCLFMLDYSPFAQFGFSQEISLNLKLRA